MYLFILYVIILTKLLILDCDFLVTIINLIYDMILLNGFSLIRDFFLLFVFDVCINIPVT